MTTWIQDNWTLVLWGAVSTILIPAAFYYGKRQQSRIDHVTSSYARLLEDLKFNLGVAKKEQPWSEYSVEGRNLLSSLDEKLSDDLKGTLRQLYLDCDATNQRIKMVKRGWWSEGDLERCYRQYVNRINEMVDRLSESG